MTTEDMIISFSINIISSIVFTIFLYATLRPNIKISPYIAVTRINNDIRYQFKIINRSLFPAYNIDIELSVRKLIATGNDQFYIQYIKQDLDIYKFKRLYPTSFNSNVDLYAIRTSTKENLREILEDPNNTLELTIYSTHGLSAFSKIFIQKFSTIDTLKNAQFKHGNNLDVV